jgi:hypothetical protein
VSFVAFDTLELKILDYTFDIPKTPDGGIVIKSEATVAVPYESEVFQRWTAGYHLHINTRTKPGPLDEWDKGIKRNTYSVLVEGEIKLFGAVDLKGKALIELTRGAFRMEIDEVRYPRKRNRSPRLLQFRRRVRTVCGWIDFDRLVARDRRDRLRELPLGPPGRQ